MCLQINQKSRANKMLVLFLQEKFLSTESLNIFIRIVVNYSITIVLLHTDDCTYVLK